MKQAVTAKVKLPFSQKLIDTMEQYSQAVQFCIDTAWENSITVRKQLHDECYYEVRERFDLPAQLTCNVLQHAVETVKGRNGSNPEVEDNYSVRYNFPRSASVSENWDTLSLSTLEGREKFDIEIPACYQDYLDREVRESTLIEKNGELYFCFVFVKEVNVDVRRDSRILGVDLGVNKVAVTSDGDFYGTEVKQKRVERDQFVADLQAKGTHEAHNRIEEYESRWKRFMSWKNHNISRHIVEKMEPGDVVVMEDLTHIREGNGNEWVHKWSFRELQDYIEYKATLKGVRVVYVDPKNTSKRCNRCHSLHTERNGGFFECKRCGHTLDADLNAARNIAQRYMRITGQAGSCKPAHESGNHDAECEATASPHPSPGLEAENTRKPLPNEAVGRC